MYVLISAHKDGRIVARAMQHLGIHSVAGSSTRGGRRAANELIEHLKEGHHVSITPDGPRGPARNAKNGAVKIAKQAGVQIYPVAASAERCWRFRSWDRMILPKPFSRAVQIIGQPLDIPPEADETDLEQYRRKLELALNQVSDAADNYFKSDRSCQ